MNKKCLMILITLIFWLVIYNFTFEDLYSCKWKWDEQCIIEYHSHWNINIAFDGDSVCLWDWCLERKNVLRSAKEGSIDEKSIWELYMILMWIINLNIVQIILSFFIFLISLFIVKWINNKNS